MCFPYLYHCIPNASPSFFHLIRFSILNNWIFHCLSMFYSESLVKSRTQAPNICNLLTILAATPLSKANGIVFQTLFFCKHFSWYLQFVDESSSPSNSRMRWKMKLFCYCLMDHLISFLHGIFHSLFDSVHGIGFVFFTNFYNWGFWVQKNFESKVPAIPFYIKFYCVDAFNWTARATKWMSTSNATKKKIISNAKHQNDYTESESLIF